ncbi:MAG TPA: type 1 glutamine amidotransferase [Burkholderiales bacterium]
MGGPLKVGVSARLAHPQPGAKGIYTKTLQYLEQSVAHWIMAHGALVLMVPTIEKQGEVLRSDVRVSDYADALDGLVLQGGADVSPTTYGEEPLRPEWAGDRVRDLYEIELVQAFVEVGKPVLGICRGAQLINVAFGGSLHQDISGHRTDDYEKHRHEMRIQAGTSLSRVYPNVERALVTSIHHQAIQRLGRGLQVEAWSEPDGHVEAIRATGERYVAGVQWHPEFHPANPGLLDSGPILQDFLDAARGAAA